MKCVICKSGETAPGNTTLTLERGKTTVVFKNVPARICGNCGEAYIEQVISERLLAEAGEAARAGVLVDIREFAPAA